MIKAVRENRVIEQLELCGRDGETVAILDIDINVNEMGGPLNQAYNSVLRAQQNINALSKIGKKIQNEVALTSEDLEKCEAAQAEYGKAVIAMFKILFGEENTLKILDFYENRYIEMSNQIFPFIFDVIMPAVEKNSADRRAILANNYRSSRTKKKKNPFKKR